LERSDHGGYEVGAWSDSEKIAGADKISEGCSSDEQVDAEIGEHYTYQERVREKYPDVSFDHSRDQMDGTHA
jgi:hypothetical protein